MQKKSTRGTKRISNSIQSVFSEVLTTIRLNADCFPLNISKTRIALTLANGERLEVEVDSIAIATTEPNLYALDPAHLEHFSPLGLEAKLFTSIEDLDLASSAKAAAEDLLAQFPSDVKFTSGRRSISDQASAMSPNVARNRKWIEQTYKDTPQRAALQKWVDDHPEAKTSAAITTGLKSVMAGWTESQKRNFSRHITGDAFDVQPVGGNKGEKIKQAIAKLPNLQWHTFVEGGLEIWHAQFDA